MSDHHDDPRDEPVKVDLDPEAFLKGLLAVDPDSEPVSEDDEPTS